MKKDLDELGNRLELAEQSSSCEYHIIKDLHTTIIDILSPLENPENKNGLRKNILPLSIDKKQPLDKNSSDREELYNTTYNSKFVDSSGKNNEITMFISDYPAIILEYQNYKVEDQNTNPTSFNTPKEGRGVYPIAQAEKAANKFIEIYQSHVKSPENKNE